MQSKDTVVEKLSVLLASSYTLYLKTQNYHWNVTGPMFTTLHTLFETQYSEVVEAVDEIAERIRALGARAPASYSEYARLSRIEEDSTSPTATAMLEALAADQATLAATARAVIHAALEIDDDATADLGTRRIDAHEKNAWMLRSHLQ